MGWQSDWAEELFLFSAGRHMNTWYPYIYLIVTNIIIILTRRRWSRKLEAISGSSGTPISADWVPTHYSPALISQLALKPRVTISGVVAWGVSTHHLDTWTIWTYRITAALPLLSIMRCGDWSAATGLAFSMLTFFISYAMAVFIICLRLNGGLVYSISSFLWRLRCPCWGLVWCLTLILVWYRLVTWNRHTHRIC